MKYVTMGRSVLLALPVIFIFVILVLVMGQGRKKTNFIQVLKQGAVSLKRWIALVLVLSMLYGAAMIAMDQWDISHQASAVLGFNYPEASSGLAPNKTRFNASEILSDTVLEKAMADGNFNNVSIDDLKACLTVQPLKAGSTISADNNYISTEYLLRYQANSKTSHLEPGTVVDMIAHAFYDDFVNTYSRKTSVLTMDFAELEELDYLDIEQMFDSKAKAIEDYANMLAAENASFQSQETGETFPSIAEKVSTFRSTQLERYKAFILSFGLAKNKNQYIAKLNYDNKITSIAYMKNVKTHEVCLETIDKYERDMARIVLVPSEDTSGQYYMSRTKIGVDYFADEAEKSMQQAADQQLEVETNNYAIQQMLNSAQTEAAVLQADAMVESLKNEYAALSEAMIRTVGSYDKKTTNDYITIITSHVNRIGSSEMKKGVILGVIFALSLCILIMVFPHYGGIVLISRTPKKPKTPKKSAKKSAGIFMRKRKVEPAKKAKKDEEGE